MTTRLRAVYEGGYVESISVDEESLQAVVAMLGIDDERPSSEIRDRIYRRLEDFATRRVRTIRAKRVDEDERALRQVLGLAEVDRLTEPVREVLKGFDSLRESNPVLYRRLERLIGGSELHHRLRELERIDDTLAAFGLRIEQAASTLQDECASESRRGRVPDDAALAFASSLYKIWVEYTGRGTSRQNAPDRERDPFGDFVDAAGKLVDPDFKGHYYARQIHEAAREESAAGQPSGEK